MSRYRIAVPTADCRGMDVADRSGATVASYSARDGFIYTDNPHHAKILRTMAGSGTGESVGFVQSSGGKYCKSCAFHAFDWSSVCPRCGAKEFDK